MRRIAVFVVCYIIWCIYVWPYSATYGWDGQSLIVGLIASILVAVLLSDTLARHPVKFLHPHRYFWALVYAPVLLYHCLKANFHVAYLVLHPQMPILPGIVRVKTSLKGETARTALANSITLTPGTLSVDIKDDGTLFVHWLVVEAEKDEDATRIIVGKFEGLLKKIFE